MGLIFLLCWIAQAVAGWAAYNSEQLSGKIRSAGSATSDRLISGTGTYRIGSPSCWRSGRSPCSRYSCDNGALRLPNRSAPSRRHRRERLATRASRAAIAWFSEMAAWSPRVDRAQNLWSAAEGVVATRRISWLALASVTTNAATRAGSPRSMGESVLIEVALDCDRVDVD